MIGVCSNVPGYRIATAELPLRARLTSSAAGAMVAIQGDRRWVQAARAALASDAAGVIISDPGPFDVDDCAELEDSAAGRPIIVDRPLLRADVIESAVARMLPSYVAVDVAAAAGRRARTAREAVGWMRVLTGGRCEVLSVDRTASAGLMLVQRTDAAVFGALTATTITGADEGAWIRALAVAETRVEVLVDEANARASVDVAAADGVLQLPRRFETHERLSLRRAIAALASSDPVTDLADLRADAAAAGLLRENHADKQH